MYDMEHTAIGTIYCDSRWPHVAVLIWFRLKAKSVAEANIIAQVLDIGAYGIMVPMVETPRRQQILSGVPITRPLASAALPFRLPMMTFSQVRLCRK